MRASASLYAPERLRSGLGVCLVTDAEQCAERGVLATVEQAVAGGVTMVQVRAKNAPVRQLLAAVVAVGRAVGDRVPVLVNDRIDVFLAARERAVPVAGIHVGQKDLPVDVVRRLTGANAVVGLTANTPQHLQAVSRLEAGTVDYLGIGVIRATQTKADHPPELGVEGFARLAASTSLPCVAIGGVGIDDLGPLRRAGGAGVAVVSGICAAKDPTAAAAAFARAWITG